MRSCPSCGGSAPPAAGWCGQCFAPLPAPQPLLVGAQPGQVSRFGQPETPEVSRFGLAQAPVAPGAVVDVRPESSGRMLSGKALALTAISIGIGVVAAVVSWVLAQDRNLEVEAGVRYALVLTLGVYVVVGALLVTQVTPRVQLRWRVGSPATGILIGATVGGGLSALLLAAVSSAAGHLSPDPRVVTMMSEGDLPHIVVTVAISCLCAPLIEEVLFRGLLLESMRHHGRRVAILVSGGAFAVWHLNPSALRYYAAMGALLGFLYIKRGLACSIAAHVAFNGVLTVAALALVLSPAKAMTIGEFSFTEPGGWSPLGHSTETSVPFGADVVTLQGPSGAELFLATPAVSMVPSADVIATRMRGGVMAMQFPDLTVDAASIRTVSSPVGTAVEVDIRYHGAGTMMIVPGHGELLVVAFMSGGSPKAQHDFDSIVSSLRTG